MTQTNNRFFDEIGRLMNDAAGAAQGVKREVETLMKAHGEGDVLELSLPKATKVNHIILQEDIVNGEQARKYTIEASINDAWKEVGRGECIGHKRIQIIDPVEISKIRLVISESEAKPKIKNFSVYFVK